jgi:hypothetical protein
MVPKIAGLIEGWHADPYIERISGVWGWYIHKDYY